MFDNLMSNFRERRRKFKEAQQENRIQKIVEDRNKTADERELNRFLEEERQKMISLKLKEFRKRRDEENKRTTVFDGKYLFKGGNSILKQKNIFRHQPNMFFQGGLKSI